MAAKKTTKKTAAKKTTTKKATAKKATKKTTAKKTATKKVPGAMSEKRVLILTALQKLKAFGPTSPASREAVAAKAGSAISEQDAVHYCYKDNDLVTNGYVKPVKVEGESKLFYHLTAKGKSFKK